jgi:glutamate-5-semialdehyde dehydrogenase
MDAIQLEQEITAGLTRLQAASRRLVTVNDAQIRQILHETADLAWEKRADILNANAEDLHRMEPQDPKYDRLLLDEKRLASICADLKNVAELASPLGRVLEARTLPNGLEIKKISVPIGVIGIVYESRPNVTFDVFALCLKSGNAVVLKGSRDAHDSNTAIVGVIRQVLAKYGLEDCLYLAPSEREALPYILQADRFVDCIIPRGSESLIQFVRNNSKVPVIETGAGIVHTYIDRSADLALAKKVITNAKTRRVSVCNALDTVLIHKGLLANLPEIFAGLDTQHQLLIYADDATSEALNGHYQADLLQAAKPEHFGTEFLSMKLAVKTVDGLEAALEHIAQYSSKHSEAVLAQDETVVEAFMQQVDAAVVYANASTAFTDGGEFGMGAEIGISTQKLHARGPMALPELTSYKWMVKGNGQVR